MGLVLVQDGKSWILHQLLVQLLELLERILVVLTSALSQDIHAEVRVRHLLLVLFLVVARELVTLPLQFLLDTRKTHLSRYRNLAAEHSNSNLATTRLQLLT